MSKRDENNGAGTNALWIKQHPILIFDEGLMNFIVSSDATRFPIFYAINIQECSCIIEKKDFLQIFEEIEHASHKKWTSGAGGGEKLFRVILSTTTWLNVLSLSS